MAKMTKAEAVRKREQDILAFLKKEISKKGYPPTVREICESVGIKSTSTVHKDLDSLRAQGYLRKDPSKPRALVVVDRDEDKAKQTPRVESKLHAVENAREDVIDVPIIGNVAAGMPILAEENFEGNFPVPAQFVRGNCFMLKVHGESMINVGIMDGDMILVEQQNTANNGDIVVSIVNDYESEATVKTFYKEKDHIRLQPENDEMDPIIVNDCSIQGKVRGVFRYFN